MILTSWATIGWAVWEYERREVRKLRCKKLRLFKWEAWSLFVRPCFHDTGARKRVNWCRTVLDIGRQRERERHDEKCANRCDEITRCSIVTWNCIIPPISSFVWDVLLISGSVALSASWCVRGFRITWFMYIDMRMRLSTFQNRILEKLVTGLLENSPPCIKNRRFQVAPVGLFWVSWIYSTFSQLTPFRSVSVLSSHLRRCLQTGHLPFGCWNHVICVLSSVPFLLFALGATCWRYALLVCLR